MFFYLCTVIPSVWFLELDLAEQRSKLNGTQALAPTPMASSHAIGEPDDILPVGTPSKYSFTPAPLTVLVLDSLSR